MFKNDVESCACSNLKYGIFHIKGPLFAVVLNVFRETTLKAVFLIVKSNTFEFIRSKSFCRDKIIRDLTAVQVLFVSTN